MDKKNSYKETAEKVDELEHKIHHAKHELTQTKIKHEKNIVKKYSKMLLEQQEKEGKLDDFTFRLYLQEFASEIKNLENRGK